MKSLFFCCGFLPVIIHSIHATPATIHERDTSTTCLVDQLTPKGEHISHSGTCGTVTDISTMPLKAPVCSGNAQCIVPRTDCQHPGGGKCIQWSEKCSIETYTLGKDDEVCPQNLKCCEGTITGFYDTSNPQQKWQNKKPWNAPWNHHDHCGDTTTTAQAKIINSKPKAKAVAAKAVKKILHKVANNSGPISPAWNDHDDYHGEHEDLMLIWKQFLHLLQTPEGEAPKIVS